MDKMKTIGIGMLSIIGIGILFVVLGAPFIIFGLFPDCEFVKQMFSKDATDTLGYYGAVIGSGVTVFGVYWTLNYESKKAKEDRKYERQKEKAKRKQERELLKEDRENERQKEEAKRKQERELLKEERRKNSLPILRFTFDPKDSSEGNKNTEWSTSPSRLTHNYDIKFNTIIKSSIKEGKREYIKSVKTDSKKLVIFQYGELKIENLGLGAAILSDVYLYRNDKEEIVNNLQADTINNFIIPPGHTIYPRMLICSNDFSENDYLCVDFIDLYSNSYRYEISFEKYFSSFFCASKIDSEMVSALPELIDTDNT